MAVSDFDLLVVPRLGGAGAGDWAARWAEKLSTARLVAPADPADPRLESWLDALEAAARTASRPALFVGHGAGAAAIVHAAASGRAGGRGALLVAPPDDAALTRIGGARWAPLPRAALPLASLVVASRSDPDADFAALEGLARDWGAGFVDAGDAGGLDAASGHGPWPEGLMRLAGFLRGLGPA